MSSDSEAVVSKEGEIGMVSPCVQVMRIIVDLIFTVLLAMIQPYSRLSSDCNIKDMLAQTLQLPSKSSASRVFCPKTVLLLLEERRLPTSSSSHYSLSSRVFLPDNLDQTVAAVERRSLGKVT
jgi:hypothetical protein